MRFKGVFLTILIFFSICSLSFAQGLAQPPMVRLIYFVPSDRQPQPDIDTKMDAFDKGRADILRKPDGSTWIPEKNLYF